MKSSKETDKNMGKKKGKEQEAPPKDEVTLNYFSMQNYEPCAFSLFRPILGLVCFLLVLLEMGRDDNN